jgi:hypothetical protein
MVALSALLGIANVPTVSISHKLQGSLCAPPLNSGKVSVTGEPDVVNVSIVTPSRIIVMDVCAAIKGTVDPRPSEVRSASDRLSDHGAPAEKQAAFSIHCPTRILAPLDWEAVANKHAAPTRIARFMRFLHFSESCPDYSRIRSRYYTLGL